MVIEALPAFTGLLTTWPGRVEPLRVSPNTLGLLKLRVTPEAARNVLALGHESLTIEIALESNPDRTSSITVRPDDVFRIAAAGVTGTAAGRRDQWRALYDACPTTANRVRSAVWARLEPLEQTVPFSAKLVQLTTQGSGWSASGRGRRFKAARVYEMKHRVGRKIRHRYESLPPGTELFVKLNGKTISYRPKVGSDGYFNVGLSEGVAEKWLREGRGLSHFTIAVPGVAKSTVEWKLTAAALSDMANREITGSIEERCGQWRAIYEACPKSNTQTRIAIERISRHCKQRWTNAR